MRPDPRPLLLALALACAAALPARAERIADFMVMDVCLDADGAVLQGAAPIDPGCQRRRKIAAGELPPYRLRNWPPRDAACHDGLLIKYNLPVRRNGVERIVSFTDRATASGCDTAPDAEAELARGLSVQGHDAGYGYIMASWSPVAMSSFESPLCNGPGGDARRFERGWVLGPAELPPPGRPGWGVFPSRAASGPAALAGAPCPARYNAGLTLWLLDTMDFGAARLPALVTHHFARADAAGIAPGPAQQVERTYWTHEFGLTRWEKWAREDWVHPRSARPAAELAAALFARGRCTRPYALPAILTPGLHTLPLAEAGLWRQVFIDPRTGERHPWVMTLCEDYTNIVRAPPSAAALADASRLDDAYWRAPPAPRTPPPHTPPARPPTAPVAAKAAP